MRFQEVLLNLPNSVAGSHDRFAQFACLVMASFSLVAAQLLADGQWLYLLRPSYSQGIKPAYHAYLYLC